MRKAVGVAGTFAMYPTIALAVFGTDGLFDPGKMRAAVADSEAQNVPRIESSDCV